jgi:alkylated DNA repair dioxygenase AlkB
MTDWIEIFKGPRETSLSIRELKLDKEIITDLWNTELNVKPTFMLYDKECRMRRNIGFFSDHSSGYNYTNQTAESKPLTENMKKLLRQVNELTNQDFNGLLFNLYVDGNDYIGSHRDDEKNLTDAGVVALSLGATRKFRIRDWMTKKILADIPTKDCELMWMQGTRFHKDLTHEVPVEKKVKQPRPSITFRQHV